MPDNMPMDGMDESYSGSAAVKPPEVPKESVDQENEEAGEDTAIVSNKILSPGGETMNAGDEIVVTVVKNYGDESEIKFTRKSGAEATPSTQSADETSNKEISALDTGE